jgi:hypothetical protein
MRKVGRAVRFVSFYGFNVIVIGFMMDIYKRKSIDDLFVFGSVVLATVAVLAGICYAAAPCATSDAGRRVFIMSGHRFLHCFLTLVFALFFVGAVLQIQSNGFLGIRSRWLSIPVTAILIPFGTVSLGWAGRSFIMGYHMLRDVLDEMFSLKDETLWDDISKENRL